MTGPALERREAWRSAAWSSALDLVVGLLATLVLRSTTGLPVWYVAQFAAVGGLLLGVVLTWRRAPRWVYLALLQLNFASGLLAALGAGAVAERGVQLQYLEAVRSSIFAVAILSPSVLVGVLWLAIFSLAPVVEIYGWPAPWRGALPAGEPWFVPVFGCIGLMLLLYRRRGVRLERALAAASAERTSLERLARVALLLRDLANTPLQTLAAGIALLRHRPGPHARVLDSMDRALLRLAESQQALAPFAEHLEWQPHDEAFDAAAQLEETASTLRRPGTR